MEEERVVCFGIFDQPPHSAQDIGLRWEPSGVISIVCQDHNVLLFKIPVSCKVGRVSGTAVYEGCTKLTHEKFANVPGVVHAAIQFSGRPRVVDSDLNGRRVGQHQVWSEDFREHVHRPPSSFPYISSSGIPGGDHGWVSTSPGEEVALGHRSWKIQRTVGGPGNVGEVPPRTARD